MFFFYNFTDIVGKGGWKVVGSHYHCYPRFRPAAQSSIGQTQTQELSPANIITQFHLLQEISSHNSIFYKMMCNPTFSTPADFLLVYSLFWKAVDGKPVCDFTNQKVTLTPKIGNTIRSSSTSRMEQFSIGTSLA